MEDPRRELEQALALLQSWLARYEEGDQAAPPPFIGSDPVELLRHEVLVLERELQAVTR